MAPRGESAYLSIQWTSSNTTTGRPFPNLALRTVTISLTVALMRVSPLRCLVTSLSAIFMGSTGESSCASKERDDRDGMVVSRSAKFGMVGLELRCSGGQWVDSSPSRSMVEGYGWIWSTARGDGAMGVQCPLAATGASVMKFSSASSASSAPGRIEWRPSRRYGGSWKASTEE